MNLIKFQYGTATDGELATVAASEAAEAVAAEQALDSTSRCLR